LTISDPIEERPLLHASTNSDSATSPACWRTRICARARRHEDIFFALALAIGAFFVYLASPIAWISDSRYALLVSEALLMGEGFALDAFLAEPLSPQEHPEMMPGGRPYFIERSGGHVYHSYPPGGPVLTAPLIPLLWWAGYSTIDEYGEYSRKGEDRLQLLLAAILGSCFVAGSFLFARHYVNLLPALMIALVVAYGSPVWSSFTRALWSQTWGALLTLWAIASVARSERGGRPWNPLVLGTLLSWMYFTRPALAVHIVIITAWASWVHPRKAPWLVLTGALWLAAFVAYSYALFDAPLPAYYRLNMFSSSGLLEGLAGVMVSPSRGVLIYWPWLWVIAYALWRGRGSDAHSGAVLASLGAIVLQLALIGCFGQWWGGHSYGPRLQSDLLPWCVLLGAVALARCSAAGHFRIWEKAVIGLLLAFSIFIHSRGALDASTWTWHALPEESRRGAGGHWDWEEPQFLAGLMRPLPSTAPALRVGKRITFDDPRVLDFLPYGWFRFQDTNMRWSVRKRAAIAFRPATGEQPSQLNVRVRHFTVGGRFEARVLLNGQFIGSIKTSHPWNMTYEFPLPDRLDPDLNVLTFEMDSARSPASLAWNTDRRLLGLGFEWMELQ